jgi:uncharacterized DUF497 family protein
MKIEKRSMNWMPKLSAYEEAMKLVNKRRTMAAGHLSDGQSAAVAFSNVRSTQIASVSQISTYAVKSRIAKLA